MSATLLLIDPQNDFCDVAGAALPVPGANADMLRLSGLIARASRHLTEIVITLDSHSTVSIERTTFWEQAEGAPVAFPVRSREKVCFSSRVRRRATASALR
ncbi:MAG: hypothetical protein WDO68_24350 [Gammaproteobacteria bacterium]